MRWLDSITNNGREFEQTQGNSEGQGSLVCYIPWGCKESDMTYQLNNNNIKKKKAKNKPLLCALFQHLALSTVTADLMVI